MSKTKIEIDDESVSASDDPPVFITLPLTLLLSFATGGLAIEAMNSSGVSALVLGGAVGLGACMALWVIIHSAVKSALKGE